MLLFCCCYESPKEMCNGTDYITKGMVMVKFPKKVFNVNVYEEIAIMVIITLKSNWPHL